MSDIETLNRYQVEALRTAASSPDPLWRKNILALGLAGETGEVIDLIKKEIGHGHPADPAKVAIELGDLLWYIANLADAYELSMSDIATMNITKLKARYPDGFSTERSLNRG
jgi:NTP pyrophosphatase (non-canonical NTP hydrolase)